MLHTTQLFELFVSAFPNRWGCIGQVMLHTTQHFLLATCFSGFSRFVSKTTRSTTFDGFAIKWTVCDVSWIHNHVPYACIHQTNQTLFRNVSVVFASARVTFLKQTKSYKQWTTHIGIICVQACLNDIYQKFLPLSLLWLEHLKAYVVSWKPMFIIMLHFYPWWHTRIISVSRFDMYTAKLFACFALVYFTRSMVWSWLRAPISPLAFQFVVQGTQCSRKNEPRSDVAK